MRRRVLTALLIVLLLAAFCAAAALLRPNAFAERAQESEETAPPVPEEAALPSLRISEVMSSNDSCIVGGLICDWVELTNTGETPVELEQCFLSKDAAAPFDCRLPSLTLEPGDHIVLRCGVELDYNISRAGEELYLTAADGRCVDTLVVPALEPDASYTYDGGVTDAPTPGAANTPEEAVRLAGDTARLILSEIVPANASYWPVSGAYYDLVELCNNGRESVSLGDYWLSDSKSEPRRWQLPDVTLAPGEYYVALCSGLGGEQAPFRLSAEGEGLYLSDASGFTDALACPAVPRDRSWGRSGAELVYFANPTPGTPNGSGYVAITAAPVASVASGFYSEPFTVTLSGEGTIRYTTDGSTPTAYSRVYAGEEIAVEGSLSLRAFCEDGERIPSGVVTFNYFLNIPDYELDVVKVSLSPVNVRGGLSERRGTAKFPANIALYVEGEEQFNVPCGISLFGSGSRGYAKLSYQINFSGAYGPTKLHYKLFERREQTAFDTIVLRSGSQDQAYATMRDELITSIFDDCSDSLVTLAYRPVDLYINESYMGIYYIRERTCAETIAAQDGVSDTSVGIVKSITGFYGTPAQAGRDLAALLRSIRAMDMSDAANYEAVSQQLNMESVIDFFIAQMWCTNYDINNARMVRSDADGGRWRFLLYDVDVAFLKTNENSVRRMYTAYDGLLSALMANAQFKANFTARLGELLAGPLREDVVLARLDAMTALLDADMHYNCVRWKATRTYEQWLAQVKWLREEENIGIVGWTDDFIRQYIAVVQPSETLIRECFGAEYVV